MKNNSLCYPNMFSHLMSTETIKVRRFVRGLADPLFFNLFLMVRRMLYAEIIDATYGLKSGREEQKAAKKSNKKQKIKGPFSGGSNFEGAQGYQSRHQPPLVGATSFRPAPMSVSTSWSWVGSVSQPGM